MKKLVLIPLILGGVLAVSGGILVGCSFKDARAITNTHDLTDKSYSKIDIDLETSDVEFIASEESKVVCVESKNIKHEVLVENDTLKITAEGKQKWIQIFEPSKKVKIYTPVKEFASLNIDVSTGDVAVPSGFTFAETNFKLSTGDVDFKANVGGKLNIVQSTGDLKLDGVSAAEMYLESSTGKKELYNVNVSGDVKIKASTGKTKLNKFTCHSLVINASTGDIDASEAVMSGDLTVEVSTGDVTFKNSNAQAINIKTSTGDVTLSLLSSHDVEVETDTGRTDYPHHAEGPACDIKTDTGDVKVTFVS